MKRVITIVSILIVAGAKLGSASAIEELRGNCGDGTAVITAAAVPAPAPEGAGLDVRKVFLMQEAETWAGPFTIQFGKDVSLETVTRILKEEKLEAKEIVAADRGLYARIEMKEQFGWTTMDTEFAWMRIMRLTDYTSVSYIQVNKRLWTKKVAR